MQGLQALGSLHLLHLLHVLLQQLRGDVVLLLGVLLVGSDLGCVLCRERRVLLGLGLCEGLPVVAQHRGRHQVALRTQLLSQTLGTAAHVRPRMLRED